MSEEQIFADRWLLLRQLGVTSHDPLGGRKLSVGSDYHGRALLSYTAAVHETFPS